MINSSSNLALAMIILHAFETVSLQIPQPDGTQINMETGYHQSRLRLGYQALHSVAYETDCPLNRHADTASGLSSLGTITYVHKLESGC